MNAGTWAQVAALVAGTFASEDLTSITAGLLVRRGEMHYALAVLACFMGIYAGDLGLWLIGRLAGSVILPRAEPAAQEAVSIGGDPLRAAIRTPQWTVRLARFLAGTLARFRPTIPPPHTQDSRSTEIRRSVSFDCFRRSPTGPSLPTTDPLATRSSAMSAPDAIIPPGPAMPAEDPVAARRFARLSEWFDRNAPAAILASRFLPGTRLPLYLAAGALGRKAGRFALWSFIGAVLWTPLIVGLAAGFGGSFVRFFQARGFQAAGSSGWLALATAALVVFLLARLLIRMVAWAVREAARFRFAADGARPRGALAPAGLLASGGLPGARPPWWRLSTSTARTTRPCPGLTIRRRLTMARTRARLSRAWRWEFWPAWLFYLPLVPWLALLSLRYRGFTTITAANPGIPGGGFVGESKSEILARLPSRWVADFFLIPPAGAQARLERLVTEMQRRAWAFPIILKPDAGQRGAGVRRVANPDDALRYLATHAPPVIAQVWHPGPHEAGIFYYRLPAPIRSRVTPAKDLSFDHTRGEGGGGEPQGRIFSITDKQFPVVLGDGVRSLRELILAHSRFSMQTRTFFRRHESRLEQIVPEGERFPLALAGNHCQGTLFRDGAHLVTPELARRIDEIALGFEGFFFGRFDVRYTDVESFRAGRDFAIVELNGATSESTNIYDPSRSLLSAYRTLFRQWSLLFEIGARNRRRGQLPLPLRTLLRETLAHYRLRAPDLLSD